MDVSVSGTIDRKTYLKKYRMGLKPPWPPPGSAYGMNLHAKFKEHRKWAKK